MTREQRKFLSTIPLDELEKYVAARRKSRRFVTPTPSPMPCPYASIPGEKACDWHDLSGCRWVNGPPPSE